MRDPTDQLFNPVAQDHGNRPILPSSSTVADTLIDDTEHRQTESDLGATYLTDLGYRDNDLPNVIALFCPRDEFMATSSDIKYYSKRVLLQFSPALSPTFNSLCIDPMDHLYFHFFINHTARGLVACDYSENPFRTNLPQRKLFKPQVPLASVFLAVRTHVNIIKPFSTLSVLIAQSMVNRDTRLTFAQ